MREQDVERAGRLPPMTHLFRGLTLHINGFVAEIGQQALKTIILENGGAYDHYLCKCVVHPILLFPRSVTCSRTHALTHTFKLSLSRSHLARHPRAPSDAIPPSQPNPPTKKTKNKKQKTKKQKQDPRQRTSSPPI
jgi:hypothetical protein